MNRGQYGNPHVLAGTMFSHAIFRHSIFARCLSIVIIFDDVIFHYSITVQLATALLFGITSRITLYMLAFSYNGMFRTA